jgi:hypothetical protein
MPYHSDPGKSGDNLRQLGAVLWMRVGSRRWERLDPAVSDEFIPHIRAPHDNRIITFRRDSEHQVVGFSIAFWRVKSLTFKKQ